jgi:hypothetical protein
VVVLVFAVYIGLEPFARNLKMARNDEEYSLVPAYDDAGNETGYYTREPDGTSGMTVGALAEFVGVTQPAITQLLNRINEADPITNDLAECLKSFAGKDLRLITNDAQGRLIIPDESCQAVAEYYAFEARQYEGKDKAVSNYRAVARAGIRVFIWSKTGFVPEFLRPSLKSNTTVYIERLENIRDHKVPDDKWTTFREGAEILLLIEKEMGVPVDQMDLCDGSIGRRWSDFRKGKAWTKPSGTYTHVFQDQRGEQPGCKAYNLAELSYFRRWLKDVYVPVHLPEYLVTKYGKLAILQVYREMNAVTDRVIEVTVIKRMTSNQQEELEDFLRARRELLPGFQPKRQIQGDS